MNAELLTVAGPGTYAAVHRIVTAVVALGGAVGWLQVPDENETTAFLDEQLALAQRGDGAFALVHDDAGTAQALGVWNRFHAPVIRQNAEIRKVMTHPDARGQGLAKHVVTTLEDDARRAGIEVLMLDARGNNHGAHRLYEALGWARCGTIPDFIAVGDERWDRVLFAKRLTTPEGAVLHGSAPFGPGASPLRDQT